MKKNAMNVVKGIGAGAAAGIIMGFVGSQIIANDKKAKKKANKTLHSVGNFIDNMEYMFK